MPRLCTMYMTFCRRSFVSAHRGLTLVLAVALSTVGLATGAAPAAAAPTAPALLTPAPNASVTLPFGISWSAASDPSGVYAYNWQVSSTTTFSKVLQQGSTMGALQDTVSGLAAGAYYWRVQGVRNNFVQGSWSAPRAVRVTGAGAGAPATPRSTSPEGARTSIPGSRSG
jgi:hypothetical protein